MLFKKQLNLFLCLIISFSFLSNVAFAGSDLDKALSPDVKPVNTDSDLNIALAANNENYSEITQKDLSAYRQVCEKLQNAYNAIVKENVNNIALATIDGNNSLNEDFGKDLIQMNLEQSTATFEDGAREQEVSNLDIALATKDENDDFTNSLKELENKITKNVKVSKEDANIFVYNFIDAILSSNKTKIEKYLEISEENIVQIFKIYGNKKQNVVRAYYYMAKGNYELGRIDVVADLYKKAINLVLSDNVQDKHLACIIFRDLAISFFEISKTDENNFDEETLKTAQECIIEAIKFYNEDFTTLYYAGIINFALFNTQNAMEYLIQAKHLAKEKDTQSKVQKEINQVQNKIEEANSFIANFLANINNLDDNEIRRYLTDSEKFTEYFKFCNNNTYIIKAPDILSYFYIVFLNLKVNDFEEAYKYCTKAISNFENVELEDKIKSSFFYSRAAALLKLIGVDKYDIKRIDEVCEDLQTAIKLDPENYTLYDCIGTIKFSLLKEYEEGLEYLKQARDLCKDNKKKQEIQQKIDNYFKELQIIEANDFIQKFIYMIEQSDTIDIYSLSPYHAGKDYSNKFVADISNYLNDENKIIKMFKKSDIKNPDVWAYFYMAEGYCIINKKKTAYEYYTKAIDNLTKSKEKYNNAYKYLFLNKIKEKDNNVYKLFRQRAWCLFEMRNTYYNKAIKLACEDIKKAIILNSKDWLTFYYAGNIIYFSLANEDILAVKLLKHSKSLCNDGKIRNEIQDEINKIENVSIGKGVIALGMLFLGGGGGGNDYALDYEKEEITRDFKDFIKIIIPD